jgi:hypothetical protein
MMRALDPQTTHNLHRWQELGEPFRWVQAHRGRWTHDDWLHLLGNLVRSDFWPLDPDAVGQALEQSRRQWRNLRRWELSGQPRRWVDDRQGEWGHEDWLALLESLRQSPYWPLDPASVGAVLEELKNEWRNLREWQRSGEPRRWVEAHEGQWDEDDWLELCEGLQRSAHWPLDTEAARRVLQRVTAQWCNLRRWQGSGQPRIWVEVHKGEWGHDDWLALLDVLRRSQYWPLDPEAVGAVLEETKRRYWNLRRWQSSGAARRWLEAHGKHWGEDDWLRLLQELERTGFWPIDPGVLVAVLEEMREEAHNLQRWQASGEALRWIEARQGHWSHDDWLDLLEALRATPFWPMDPAAMGDVLRQLNIQWWNLRRWRRSGLATLWVASHQGRWNHADWMDLVSALQRSELWPMDLAALSGVLEEARAEWRSLARRPPPTAQEAA